MYKVLFAKLFSITNQFDIKFGMTVRKNTQDNFYDSFMLYFEVLGCCRPKLLFNYHEWH